MDEDEEEPKPKPKKKVKKVDEATLKMRMDQDKEVAALREEKDRILMKIDELANRKEDKEQMREEAMHMMQ